MQVHTRTALGKSSPNTPSLSPRHYDLSVKKTIQFTVVWLRRWTALLLEHRELALSQAAGTRPVLQKGQVGCRLMSRPLPTGRKSLTIPVVLRGLDRKDTPSHR